MAQPRNLLGGHVISKTSFESLEGIEAEYRIQDPVNQGKWLWIKAKPEKKSNNEVVWFGIIQDISHKIKHMKLLEKMIFDISHVIRRPITNILTAANFIETSELSDEDIKEIYPIIIEETANLDQAIKVLNKEYYDLRKELNIV